MGRLIAGLALLLTLYIYATVAEKKQTERIAEDDRVPVDTSLLKHRYRAYVPVNLQQAPGKLPEKLILKIRNTSFLDSIYLSRVAYYNRQGKLVKDFVGSVRLIKPMATGELVIKSAELEEPGDNFIVQWHSGNGSKALIQSVVFDKRSRVVMTDHGVLLSDEESMAD